MIDLPRSTYIHKRIPKEAFYSQLALNSALKKKFAQGIESIYVENSLTKDNLNLSNDSNISEILLLSVTLKEKDLDSKIIEAIAKQNPHKLVFSLIYASENRLAIYHGKLYFSPWKDEADLKAEGSALEEIWEGFIEQIALRKEKADKGKTANFSLDERLSLQEEIEKLEEIIRKTEVDAWKEIQAKKKFKLHAKLQSCRKELEELIHG